MLREHIQLSQLTDCEDWNMATTTSDKRSRLIETAVKLAYLRGFRETSIADIAEAAKVPVGNVYYYFKTKEEIGEAIVDRLLAQFRAFREELEQAGSPKERLIAFVNNIRGNREQLARGGCPLGGLCSEIAQGRRGTSPKIDGAFH